jgi:hypothetical protein
MITYVENCKLVYLPRHSCSPHFIQKRPKSCRDKLAVEDQWDTKEELGAGAFDTVCLQVNDRRSREL